MELPVRIPLGLAPEDFDWKQLLFVALFLIVGAGRAIWSRIGGAPERKGPERRGPRPRPQESPQPAPVDWRELFGELQAQVETIEPEAPEVPVEAPPPVPTEPEARPRLAAELSMDRPSEHMPGATDLAHVPSEDEPDFGLSGELAQMLAAHDAETAASLARARSGRRVRRGASAAWLDAVVAAEVLGRPVALRRGDELPGSIPR